MDEMILLRRKPPFGLVGLLIVLSVFLLSGCDYFTDAATRIAYDIESATRELRDEGDRYTLYHAVPSRRGECDGPYKVQFDKVGALIVWCRDEAGEVVASPGTSYHRRFVHTPETYILDKPAGETLVIELEKRGGRVVIIDVR